ncbi:MAG: cupin domain-containing protein [Mesorhizobium sp.]|nr:MAG: cupin domain-containing protein [Mesorhizobium sp.]
MDDECKSCSGRSVRARAGGRLDAQRFGHHPYLQGHRTAGSFSLWESVVPPGAGVPPHIHAREDEAFYVLSGELVIEFEGDSAPRRVAPGGFFFGARGRRHAVRNDADKPARVLVFCAPSCGLDQMFAELDAATGAGMPEMAKVVAIAAKYGVTIEAPAA